MLPSLPDSSSLSTRARSEPPSEPIRPARLPEVVDCLPASEPEHDGDDAAERQQHHRGGEDEASETESGHEAAEEQPQAGEGAHAQPPHRVQLIPQSEHASPPS